MSVRGLGEEEREKFDIDLDAPLPGDERVEQSTLSQEKEAESFAAFYGAMTG